MFSVGWANAPNEAEKQIVFCATRFCFSSKLFDRNWWVVNSQPIMKSATSSFLIGFIILLVFYSIQSMTIDVQTLWQITNPTSEHLFNHTLLTCCCLIHICFLVAQLLCSFFTWTNNTTTPAERKRNSMQILIYFLGSSSLTLVWRHRFFPLNNSWQKHHVRLASGLFVLWRKWQRWFPLFILISTLTAE